MRAPYATGDYASSTALFVLLEKTPIESKNKKETFSTQLPVVDERAETEPPAAVLLRTDNVPIRDSMTMSIIMMSLCWSVALLSALDRVAMSVAVIPLSEEMGYSDTTKGAISSLFSVGYGLAIIPAGLLVATLSPRLVMAMGVSLWSLATIATPLTASRVTDDDPTLLPLFLARACVGAAESVVLPTLQRLMLAWVPPERKSLAVATIFAGFQSGTVAAYLVSPAVMQIAGWRGLFYVYGAVGMLWLVPWLTLAKDAPTAEPLMVAGISISNMDSSQSLLVQEENSSANWRDALEVWKTAPWKGLFESKGVWAILLAHAANNWGLYNSLAWTPTFYSEQYGLDVRDSAWLSVLPSVAGAVGGFFAGSIADTIISNLEERSDKQITMVRKVFQGIALYGPALSLAYLASNIPDEAWIAQFLLMGTVGMQAFNAAGYGAANQEKAGERWAGLLYSATSLPGVMIGSLGVFATGQILDLSHQNWSIVFGINALVNVLGATAFVSLYNSTQEFD